MSHKVDKKKVTYDVCNFLEIIMSIFVLIGIVIGIVGLIPAIKDFYYSREEIEAFTVFIGKVSILVVGIEFLKMLYKPTSDNVLETVIFLVARHMIVAETSPLEDLISAASIVILCITRGYLKSKKDQAKEKKTQKEKELEETQDLTESKPVENTEI